MKRNILYTFIKDLLRLFIVYSMPGLELGTEGTGTEYTVPTHNSLLSMINNRPMLEGV